MEIKPFILALSLDFERFEAALVDIEGGISHIETAPVRIISSGHGKVYIDPVTLINIAGSTVKTLLERRPREARRIMGVGLIGRSPSAAFVDSSGVKSAFILPEDARAREGLAAICVPEDEVYRVSGLTPLRREIPSLYATVPDGEKGKFLTPKDYLKWVLTDEFTTDPLDAQRTFLFDVEKREWSEELCDIFKVDRGRFADVAPATSPAGTITERASKLMGIKAGLPVSCGMGDWGEYLGSGVWEECDAFEHIGTTAAFYGVVDARPPAELCLEVRPHVKNGLYLAGRELLSGGMCLEWLLRKSYLSRNGVIDWALVDDEFEAIAAMHRPENVLFFARTGGRDGQLLHAAFLDLLIEDNLTSLLQGLMEGIFFELKDVAEQLAAIPWKAKDVYTTGQVGWKHSPRRTRAHIYGVPIHAGRAPGANLVSAALVGAVAGGAFEDIDEARANMLDIGGATQPDEKVRDLYAKHFERWLARRDELIRLSDD